MEKCMVCHQLVPNPANAGRIVCFDCFSELDLKVYDQEQQILEEEE